MALNKTARELKNEAHIKTIVQSASALFQTHGFERVTVDDICEAARVSKSTFYNLFKSKDDLLMIGIGDERCNYIQQHYHYDENRSLQELFRDFFQVNYDYTRTHTHLETRQIYRSDIITRSLSFHESNLYSQELLVLIHRGIKEKQFRADLSVEDFHWYITDTMIGCFIGWCAQDQYHPSIDDRYQRIIQALADSFLKTT